jgi:hypothetical protein
VTTLDIDATFIFAQPDFVNVHHSQRKKPAFNGFLNDTWELIP